MIPLGIIDDYRRAGCQTTADILNLAACYGHSALFDARMGLLEAGRQNSTALAVVSGIPPGKNVCSFLRSLAKDRSRLIVIVRPGRLSPGAYERMLRASIPDYDKRIRVIETDGSLVNMISAAVRNRHYSPKQVLEVFCDSVLAQEYAHDSTRLDLEFDVGLVSVHPVQVPSDDADAIMKALEGEDSLAQHRVLDPHIFSSPEGMAEYKNSLMGSSKGEIREFLSDIASSHRDAIALLRDILMSSVDDFDSLHYLGSGRNGSAYRSPDGFILKITTDEKEAGSAMLLAGLQTKHLGLIYSIDEAAPGIWIISQEDLDRLPENLSHEFDHAMGVIGRCGAIDSLNQGDIRGVLHILAGAGPDSRGPVGEAISILAKFGVAGMCAELSEHGLSADFHAGNVMTRQGHPVLIDIGTPGDSRQTTNSGSMNEFGTGSPGSGVSGPVSMRGSNSSSWSNGRGALDMPVNHIPEDENADETDYALDWGPGRVSGGSF